VGNKLEGGQQDYTPRVRMNVGTHTATANTNGHCYPVLPRRRSGRLKVQRIDRLGAAERAAAQTSFATLPLATAHRLREVGREMQLLRAGIGVGY